MWEEVEGMRELAIGSVATQVPAFYVALVPFIRFDGEERAQYDLQLEDVTSIGCASKLVEGELEVQISVSSCFCRVIIQIVSVLDIHYPRLREHEFEDFLRFCSSVSDDDGTHKIEDSSRIPIV